MSAPAVPNGIHPAVNAELAWMKVAVHAKNTSTQLLADANVCPNAVMNSQERRGTLKLVHARACVIQTFIAQVNRLLRLTQTVSALVLRVHQPHAPEKPSSTKLLAAATAICLVLQIGQTSINKSATAHATQKFTFALLQIQF